MLGSGFWLEAPTEAARGPGARTRLALFCGALAVFYLALDRFTVIEMGLYLWGREDVARPELYTLLYLGAYGLGIAGWVAMHAHASPTLRYGSYAVSAVTVTIFLAFAQINGRGFSITEATLLWEEVEFIGDAVSFFSSAWLPPLLLVAAVLGVAEWSLGTRMPRLRPRSLALLPLVAAAGFYFILLKSDARLEQFPVPYRVAVLTAYAFEHQVVWLGTREAPYFEPAEDPIAPHIVFVVDESIRGDWLGVNGGRAGTTPFLSSIARDSLGDLNQRLGDLNRGPGNFNYGVASAVANLSGSANILLQSGLRPDELPDTDMRSMKSPSVFAYMRAAGFATFLLDAQHGMGRPPNFMTDADIAALDGQLLVRDTTRPFEEWDADRLLIPALVEIIRREERSFSYVLKIGAHFPYSVRFAPDDAAFSPADVADEYEGDRAQVISDYLNTLRHGVDGFLRELLEALAAEERDVVVVYTADHGQSLFEPWGPDERRARGHGQSPNPPPHQARVPLFVFALGEGPTAALSSLYDPSLRDRTSAFEIFPSLLRLAGYGREDLATRYHHSIFDLDADRSRRVFVSGNHFGADGPLYREAPYRSSFDLNDFDAAPRGEETPK